MALNFPNNPTDGQTYTAEGVTYEYSAAVDVWFAYASGGGGGGGSDLPADNEGYLGNDGSGNLSWNESLSLFNLNFLPQSVTTGIRFNNDSDTTTLVLGYEGFPVTPGRISLGDDSFSSQLLQGDWLQEGSGKLAGAWGMDRLQLGPNNQTTEDDIFIDGDAVIASKQNMQFTSGRGEAAVFRWANKTDGDPGSPGMQNSDQLMILESGEGLRIQTGGGGGLLQLGGSGWDTGTDRIRITTGGTNSRIEADGAQDQIQFTTKSYGTVPYRIVYAGASSSTNILNRDDGDARYQQSSHSRYKENIEDADEADLLALYDQLAPKTFTRGGETLSADPAYGRTQFGLVIDDIDPRAQSFIRETDEEGQDTDAFKVLGFETGALFAALIAKINHLEDEIETLKGN